MDELFKSLAKLGICKTGQRYWSMSNKDLDTIIKSWKQWPEFMAEHGESAIHMLRRFIKGKELIKKLASNNIYLDTVIDSKKVGSDTNVTIAGNTSGVVIVEGYSVTKIYTYNDSDITVVCKDNAIVGVEAYHKSNVNIVLADDAKFFGEQYSEAKIVSDSLIKVDKKEYIRGETFNGLEDE